LTGEIGCIECKASPTAPLTGNQTLAFPEIGESGGTIVGAGKPGFPGGMQILPTAVQILPRELRVAFAVLCAERLMPAYTAFARRLGSVDAAKLTSILGRLWRALSPSYSPTRRALAIFFAT